ncbi:MAG: hypothetical protein ACYCOU_13515 [Sulfobacillus sp.]
MQQHEECPIASSQEWREPEEDMVFVKTVRHLVVSRNLLCQEAVGADGQLAVTDEMFRNLLNRHVKVVEALCAACETTAGDRRWIDNAARHLVPLRAWLTSGAGARGKHLTRTIRALAHAEDTVLLPMATLLMESDEWHELAAVVDHLGQAIMEEEVSRMTGMRGRDR